MEVGARSQAHRPHQLFSVGSRYRSARRYELRSGGGELAGEITGQTAGLEHYLGQALRDFKAALEGIGQETAAEAGPERRAPAAIPAQEEVRSTGTHGRESDLSGHPRTSRFGGVPKRNRTGPRS